jgi:hypothetical protein
MDDIPNKPPQSPQEPGRGSSLVGGPRTRPGLIVAAFLWAAVMFFALPALTAPRHGPIRRPIEFQVITAFVTALALFGLARSVSGWRHLLVAPLWAILIFMEYVAWIWPSRPW